VLNAGANPQMCRLYPAELADFTATWDTDFKAWALFAAGGLTCRRSAWKPCPVGSSGAAVTIAALGGYAVAKPHSLFMAMYSQWSRQQKGGLHRFQAIVPLIDSAGTGVGDAGAQRLARAMVL